MDTLEKLKKDNQIYQRVSGGIITVSIEERQIFGEVATHWKETIFKACTKKRGKQQM